MIDHSSYAVRQIERDPASHGGFRPCDWLRCLTEGVDPQITQITRRRSQSVLAARCTNKPQPFRVELVAGDGKFDRLRVGVAQPVQVPSQRRHKGVAVAVIDEFGLHGLLTAWLSPSNMAGVSLHPHRRLKTRIPRPRIPYVAYGNSR